MRQRRGPGGGHEPRARHKVPDDGGQRDAPDEWECERQDDALGFDEVEVVCAGVVQGV